MKTWKCLCFLACLLIFDSCRKDEKSVTVNDEFEKYTQLIATNSIIVLRNEKNDLVSGAVMTLDGTQYTSNTEGLIFLKNVPLKNTGHLVQITHPAYFKTGKRIYPNKGIIELFLISKGSSVQFASQSASTVSFSGINYQFPANSLVDANGLEYKGDVNIYARHLNPTSPLFGAMMPADLRAYDIDGNSVYLTSFGMVATELYGSNGQALQIAPGKKVKISMHLDNSIVSNAPNSLPIWYIAEQSNTGIWKEEGRAIKVNSNYEFEVSHFSFWNCDVPGNYVNLKGQVKNLQGATVANLWVTVTVNGGPSGYAVTDGNGKFEGKVPAGVDLKIQINEICDTFMQVKLYEANLGVLTSDTDLGMIQVDNQNINTYEFTGKVEVCPPNNLGTSYVKFTSNQGVRYLIVNPDSSFNFTSNCLTIGEPVSFEAADYANGLQSGVTSLTLTNQKNVQVPNLTICTAFDEYVSVSYNGSQEYYYKRDGRILSIGIYQDSLATNEYAFYFYGSGLESFNRFVYNGLNVPSPFLNFYLVGTLINGTSLNLVCTQCLNIEISQFDLTGGYIIGKYWGTSGQNSVSGKFRIKT
ncbi:MAG: hypothetical protein IPI45_12610 [Saprospiraceae bacterium]|nr:hypothetical protein [Saprospiraceae bacterium]MBK7738607.1 hypothetical protein [Saprospiraceae bacterium]MBK7912821.1 hypothetical protein [Saprospiraceae bacterium]